MAGMNVYIALQELEKRAKALGFKFVCSQRRYDSNEDLIGLKPLDKELPIYSRDAELFHGNHTEVDLFLRGIEFAHNYNTMTGACTTHRRKQYDAKEVARQERIKYNKEKLETFKTLKKEHV